MEKDQWGIKHAEFCNLAAKILETVHAKR